MKNTTEIQIAGYGNLRVTKDGYICSRDITKVGERMMYKTKSNLLAGKKSVLINILTNYLINIHNNTYKDGIISLEYKERESNLINKLVNDNPSISEEDVRLNITILIDDFVKEVIERYKKSNPRKYSLAKLLNDMPGYRKMINYGPAIGKAVYYNKEASIFIAGGYSTTFMLFMIGHYADPNIAVIKNGKFIKNNIIRKKKLQAPSFTRSNETNEDLDNILKKRLFQHVTTNTDRLFNEVLKLIDESLYQHYEYNSCTNCNKYISLKSTVLVSLFKSMDTHTIGSLDYDGIISLVNYSIDNTIAINEDEIDDISRMIEEL